MWGCDLAVIGGGFSGLWTALLAKEADPDRDVVLVDGGRIAWAASGRNGGFCAASLTHGEANGRARFAGELATLDQLGRQNLDRIEQAVARYSIDCGFERTGELDVATEAYQVDELRAAGGEFLDREAVRAELDSPTYLAGRWDRDSTALLDPARLAWGLARAAEGLGVGSSKAPGSPTSPTTAPDLPYAPPAGPSGRAGLRWRPMRSPACCGGCGCTPSRSMTTC